MIEIFDMASMKVHKFRSGFWDQQEPSLTLVPSAAAASAFNRLRSLPHSNKLINPPSNVVRPLDLKSFIKPDNAGSRKMMTQADHNAASAQPGGTRWNPTQEQIGILEMLYRGGMRTPNTQQIEEITDQLANYGKIEGKNVFYWFQNHKARERQKIKRKKTLICFSSHSSRTTTNSPDASSTSGDDEEREADHDSDHQYCYKRKCRSWSTDDDDKGFELLENNRRLYGDQEEEDKITTLELFPLHPEGRS